MTRGKAIFFSMVLAALTTLPVFLWRNAKAELRVVQSALAEREQELEKLRAEIKRLNEERNEELRPGHAE